MANYTITLTEAETMALEWATSDPLEWIQNFTNVRVKHATDELVKICVDKCLENNIQIPSNKEAMILLCYSEGWVSTLADQPENTTDSSI